MKKTALSCILSLLTILSTKAQIIVSSNASNLTNSIGSNTLAITLSYNNNSCSANTATVTLAFPKGVSYITGSVIKTSR